jgi:hypothetical protein
MRSRRSQLEFACRVGVFALLGWLIGASLIPSTGRRAETVNGAALEARLPRWTRHPLGDALHVNLDATPSPWAVDWLGALQHSGHSVTWTGSPPALAISADPVADPRGGTRLEIAAPTGTKVVVRDDVGVIDSLRIADLGGSMIVPEVVGHLAAGIGAEVASVSPRDSAHIRSIVVVGAAGWEGRFIVSALEGRGWPVTARFSVAPNVYVGQSTPITLDTARVAAVIAVDSSLQGLGGAIERYVQSGGGLILAGPSSLASTAASLAPGALGPRFRPAVLPRDTISLGSTGFYPVASLKADAIALERRSAGVTMAARRVGAGRVMQIGYDDSWRWRMAGGPGSDAAHAAWWSRLVSSVAYAPSTRRAEPAASSAPVAAMIARIGPSRPIPRGADARPPVDRRVFMVLIMILLLVEWASRRLRGLR